MEETLKVKITAVTTEFQNGMKKAMGSLGDLVSKTQNVSKEVKENISKMGDACKTGLKAMGAGVGAAVGGLTTLAASTEEYRQNQAQLNAAFEQAGFTTKSATDAYRNLYKVIGDDDQAVESAANIAMLADSEQEAAKWAELASGVLGTFHDTLQPESFYEAANETLKLGEATGAFTQMLEQTGVMSVEEFNKKLNECTTEAEKQAFMLEVSEKAMGEAGDSYDKATAKLQAQREAQSKLNDTLAKVGDAMSPVLTAFMVFATDALQPVIDKIAPLAEQYAPQLQDAMSKAGEAVGNAFGFFVDHWEIFAAIAGIIAGIAAAIGLYNAVAAIKAAMDAAQVATLGALTAAMWANVTATIAALAPYIAIVAAIAAVIAIIVLCVKHWDEIKEVVKKVAESIKEEVSKMAEKVGQLFDFIKETVSEKVEAAKQAATTAFDNIKNGISDKVTAVKEKVSSTFENIKSDMKSKVDAAKTTVLNVFDNIKNGIKEKINWAKDTVKTAIDKIKGFFNFSWKLPDLKLPHPYITGKFSLNPPQVPSFGIRWYRKAMDEAMVLNNPTIFGMQGGNLLGGGEAGAEVISGEAHLMDLIRQVVREEVGGGGTVVMEVDGTKLGEVSVKGINRYTGLAGSCQLRYV